MQPNNYHEALGQLTDRFTHIFENQQDRKEIIGAIASDSQIELLWGNTHPEEAQ